MRRGAELVSFGDSSKLAGLQVAQGNNFAQPFDLTAISEVDG